MASPPLLCKTKPGETRHHQKQFGDAQKTTKKVRSDPTPGPDQNRTPNPGAVLVLGTDNSNHHHGAKVLRHLRVPQIGWGTAGDEIKITSYT